jgi:hypothetical protein
MLTVRRAAAALLVACAAGVGFSTGRAARPEAAPAESGDPVTLATVAAGPAPTVATVPAVPTLPDLRREPARRTRTSSAGAPSSQGTTQAPSQRSTPAPSQPSTPTPSQPEGDAPIGGGIIE